jgi:hypothetical protein
VTVDSEWGNRTGVVVEMPFVDPQKAFLSAEQ